MRKLTTEADGRKLAIEMLWDAQNISADLTCLYPHDNPVRGDRPQRNYFLKYLKRLRKANNEEVDRGFAAVLSDFCGSAIDGGVLWPDQYEREEREAAARNDAAFQQFIAGATGEDGHA